MQYSLAARTLNHREHHDKLFKNNLPRTIVTNFSTFLLFFFAT